MMGMNQAHSNYIHVYVYACLFCAVQKDKRWIINKNFNSCGELHVSCIHDNPSR